MTKCEKKINTTTFFVEETERDNIEVRINHWNGTVDHFILGKDETSALIDALRFVRYS